MVLTMTINDPLPSAGLLRRMGALLYDGLIVIAIEMIAAGIIIAILHALMAAGLFAVGNYTDVSDFLTNHPIWSPVYTLYLASVWVYFFVYFWTKAGQTLGMRAWKLHLCSQDGALITKKQALIRITASLFGLANLIVPLHPKKRGWHDMLAGTQVVVLPKAN